MFQKLKPLVTEKCSFVNLPETRQARWGEALTPEKMKNCVWVRPEIVAQLEFLEWTDADHLRHSRFVGLREDKDARAGQGTGRVRSLIGGAGIAGIQSAKTPITTYSGSAGAKSQVSMPKR